MKILYVASGIPVPGTLGGSTHTLEVARGLTARGHTVHVVACSQLGRPNLAALARPISSCYAGFYLLCGIAAAVGQIVMNSTSTLPTIGASGAIAGVMGAYFILYPQSRVLTLIPVFWFEIIEVPAIVLLGFWFLMQLFSAGALAARTTGTGGGVAFAAHVAGFVVGMAGVFVFRKREPRWEV